jgi:hypothetical protein
MNLEKGKAFIDSLRRPSFAEFSRSEMSIKRDME